MPQLIYFVVMLVISYALQPKPPKPKPAAFEDFDFPTADDGTPQIVVFGDVWLTDWTVIGVGNFRSQPIIAKQSGLFGSKKTTTGYKYFMGIHMGICRGCDDLLEIKVGDKTAWTGTIGSSNMTQLNLNMPELFGGDKAEGGVVGNLTVMRGATDQPVLPDLAKMFTTTVPAYRNVVTFFFDGLVCSNSPYPKPWSFRVRRITSNWDGSIWYPSKASIWLNDNKIQAMNPAHVIYEAQTNNIWGRGFAASQLDLASFQAAADQLFNEDFGICLAWRRQESLSEFIQQIVNTIGAALFLDRLTGLWKLVLIRENYEVDTLPLYNSSNGLLNIAEDNNAANDVSSNQVSVTFRDPITNQDQQIKAENVAAIQKYGVITETKNYAGLPVAALAGRVAARDLKISQSSLKKFKLIFDRRAFQMQPMSVFKISAPEQNINSLVLRAIRVEHDNITNGQITVTALQDVFGLADQNFINTQPNLNEQPNYTARLPKRFIAEPNKNEFRILELTYYDVCNQFTNGYQKQFGPYTHYVGLIIKELSPMHMYFELWLQHIYRKQELLQLWEIVYNNNSTIGHFAVTVKLVEPMPLGYEKITVAVYGNLLNISSVSIGSAALIDKEVLRVEAIDPTGYVTFSRGCTDSVAKYHAANTEVWFYEDVIAVGARPFTRKIDPSTGGRDEINFIAKTFTKYDQTPKHLMDVGLIDRVYNSANDPANVPNVLLGTVSASSYSTAFAPYPPAAVYYNNLVPLIPYLQKTLETIRWSNRNRLIQLDMLFDQTATGIELEAGCSIMLNLEIYTHLGNFTYSQNLGVTEALNVVGSFPMILNAFKADVMMYTQGDVQSVQTQEATFEFYGFGVNFGNYFGGIN